MIEGPLLISGSAQDRRVVVTGCSSGIGRAVVELLVAEQSSVVGVDVVEPDYYIDEFHRCDISNVTSVEGLVAELNGPLHGLCNAAGLPTTKSAEAIMAVNFFGLRELTDQLLPRLEIGASVVNVASCAGTGWPARIEVINELLACPTMADGLEATARLALDPVDAYFLSKEAVTVYTLALATQHVDRRIRINAVSPGAVYTPILDEFYATMNTDRLAELRALAGGREGHPEEIAAPIVFLLGRASSWVNGANLIVDGGAETAVTLGQL